MAEKEARGKFWFEENVCKTCKYVESCAQLSNIEICIEAEKLKNQLTMIELVKEE